MGKIKKLYWKYKDKLMHITACIILTILLSIWIKYYLAATYVFVGMFVGKEVFWDYVLSKGNFDMGDVLANLIGCSVGMIITMYL